MAKKYIVVEEKNEVDIFSLLLTAILLLAIALILLYVGAFLMSGLLAGFAYICSVYYRKWKLKRLRKLRSRRNSSLEDIPDVSSNATSGQTQVLLLPGASGDPIEIGQDE